MFTQRDARHPTEKKKFMGVASRALGDRVVCGGGGLYQWAHRGIWPRAVGNTVSANGALFATMWDVSGRGSHLAGNGALVGGLALDGEGDTVRGLGLDLKVRWELISSGVVAREVVQQNKPGLAW